MFRLYPTWQPWTTIASSAHQPRRRRNPAASPVHPRREWITRCSACATSPAPRRRQFQNFVLFTNYQFYIDEFVRLGHARNGQPDSEYIAFIEPGNVVTRRGLSAELGDELGAPPRACRKCPPTTWCAPTTAASPWSTSAWARPTPRTITDHIAVLRPHAWIMLGHCAGLRNSQQLGDYVLAHGYVREDHVLDEELPLWVPIPRWPRFSSPSNPPWQA